MINVNEDILFCAFRYALGRQTYIVSVVVDEILRNWDSISDKVKILMIKEIKECNYLSDIDKPEWNKIIKKANK